MFRKLRIRGSKPAQSAPATTGESKTVDPSPHAIHISDSISIIVANAKGAADSSYLYSLLQREKAYGEFDPTDDFETDYLCDSHIYNVRFIPPNVLGLSLAYLCLMQHVCIVFSYDASSRESWGEMVAACEGMRSRCEDGVSPFLATMIAAMDEGEAPVSHVEAKAFATQRDFRFVKFSPATGRGICNAVSSLVELAHGARDKYAMDQEGYTQRYKRAEALQALSLT
ncbi:hypothetical protein LT330_009624 [Penicillium expansum]|nr:hypothetical protein LT330_009624 [Penicillium expansum]